MAETLGARLRRLREERGWNVNEAAQRVGCTAWALTLLEKKVRLGQVRVASLKRVAAAYGVTIDYLVRDIDFEPAELAHA
jgi:transcriptional regulator with XRE-family HTH domain